MTQTQEHNVPALRFPEFSGEWESNTIADVAEVKGGKRLPLGNSLSDIDTGFPYITVSDFENGSVSLEKIKFVPKSVQPSIARYTISSDDIYISVAGTLGLVGIIPQKLGGANLTENADKLTKITLNRDFLLQFLKSERLKKLIKSVQTNNAQPKLSIAAIKKMKVGFPDAPEQQKIADFLSSVDSKIEQLSKKKALLEQYKKGVMQKLFSRELRFKDANGNDFPEWVEKRLCKMAIIVMGTSPKSESYNNHSEGLPLIQGNADIRDRKSAPRVFTSVVTKECLPADILLSVRAPVGEVSISTRHACIGRGISAVRATQSNVQEFLYQFLLWYEPRWRRISQGSTFESVNSDDIKQLKCPNPSQLEQQKIADFLSSIDDKIDLITTELTQAQVFKKGLLQQMFV